MEMNINGLGNGLGYTTTRLKYDDEIRQLEERLKVLRQEKLDKEKREQERKEIEERRKKEEEMIYKNMSEDGNEIIQLRNQLINLSTQFKKRYGKVKGYDEWEGMLLLDGENNNDYYHLAKIKRKKDDDKLSPLDKSECMLDNEAVLKLLNEFNPMKLIISKDNPFFTYGKAKDKTDDGVGIDKNNCKDSVDK